MVVWLYMMNIRKKNVNHEQLHLDKTEGWNLILRPEKEYGTLSDHEYFCIHDDLFDRIKSTHQDKISFGGLYQMN